MDGHTWQQPFTARVLDDAWLTALLEDEGLRLERWLARPGWFVARRAAD